MYVPFGITWPKSKSFKDEPILLKAESSVPKTIPEVNENE